MPRGHYKRKLKVEVPRLVKAAEEASMTTAEAAAQTLMVYARFHRDEAEKLERAVKALRGPIRVPVTDPIDDPIDPAIAHKRAQWAESKRHERAKSNAQASYWGRMSPLQRRREMARRMAMRAGKVPRVVRIPMGGVA